MAIMAKAVVICNPSLLFAFFHLTLRTDQEREGFFVESWVNSSRVSLAASEVVSLTMLPTGDFSFASPGTNSAPVWRTIVAAEPARVQLALWGSRQFAATCKTPSSKPANAVSAYGATAAAGPAKAAGG